MAKTLLVTSDDMGMSHSVNLGIVDALVDGRCASSNFLAPAPWFHEAAALGRERGLDLGVHFCLGSDWDRLRWAPLTACPRLREGDGRFPQRPESLEELGAGDADIHEELKAQIELVRRVYGEPTHCDAHMLGGRGPTPFLARIQRIFLDLARQYHLAFTYERDPKTGALRHFRGELCMTLMDEAAILGVLEGWKEDGPYHLFGHAARPSEELDALCSEAHPARRWASECRVQDRRLYLDPHFWRKIEAMGFELIPRSGVRGFFQSLAGR